MLLVTSESILAGPEKKIAEWSCLVSTLFLPSSYEVHGADHQSSDEQIRRRVREALPFLILARELRVVRL